MTKAALETISRRAQAAANRDGVPMVVFNLNHYSPMYVIREWQPGAELASGFIARFEPEGEHA